MRHLYPAVAFCMLAATAARADVVVFEDEAAFLGVAPIVSTQTFDDVPDFQVPVTVEIDNVVFVTRGTWSLPGGCDLNRSLGATSIERRHISFLTPTGADGGVRAFGFALTTFGISPPADFQVVLITADGALTVETIDDLSNPTVAYRGFLSTSPITRVIVSAIGDTQFNFCMDNISRGQIRGTTD
jgi:hypothetical protein